MTLRRQGTKLWSPGDAAVPDPVARRRGGALARTCYALDLHAQHTRQARRDGEVLRDGCRVLLLQTPSPS